MRVLRRVSLAARGTNISCRNIILVTEVVHCKRTRKLKTPSAISTFGCRQKLTLLLVLVAVQACDSRQLTNGPHTPSPGPGLAHIGSSFPEAFSADSHSSSSSRRLHGSKAVTQEGFQTVCPDGCKSTGCQQYSTGVGYTCSKCKNNLLMDRTTGACACPPGTYAVPGSDRCTDCPKGGWCPGGLYRTTQPPAVLWCPAGMTTFGLRSPTSRSCVNLPGYKYLISAMNLPAAAPCPVDSYNPGFGRQRTCWPCPTGYTTNGKTGRTDASACVVPPGSFMRYPTIVGLCPRGQWKDWVGPDTFCKPCADGVTTQREGSTSAENCTMVLPGYYASSMNGTVVTETKACPQKYYCPGSTPLKPFDPFNPKNLSAADPSIKACKDGMFTKQPRSTTIKECLTPPGHFTVPGSGATLRCPDGSYRAGWAAAGDAKSCSSCGTGVFVANDTAVEVFSITDSDNRLSEEGLIDVATNPQSCFIKPGQGMYYVADTGSWRARNCVNNNWGVNSTTFGLAINNCRPCPLNMITSTNSSAFPRSASFYVDNGDGRSAGFISKQACVTQAGHGIIGDSSRKCPVGSYNQQDSYSPCTPCVTGLTTAAPGAGTTAADCGVAAGYGFHNGSIMLCPVGYYNDAVINFDLSASCKQCPAGLTTAAAGAQSASDCAAPPAVNGCATANGGCAQICNSTDAGVVQCSCSAGYTLAIDLQSCDDVNECLVSNGGCAQICTNTPGSHSCQCSTGYTLAGDGFNCIDVDECAVNNGGCAHICINAAGSYSCGCLGGYTLAPDGWSCMDVNECATSNGGCAQVCTNTLGGFSCGCTVGYILAADARSCIDVNECLVANGGCAQVCTNTPGSYSCGCTAGYTLAVDGKSCVDVNECLVANGGCAQFCTNTAGSYTCGCDAGYTLAADGKSCTDINECLVSNGGCAQVCINMLGSNSCSCNTGYTLAGDGRNCTADTTPPVIGCAFNNGGCAQICNTTAAGLVQCSCSAGYALGVDRRSCNDVNECLTGNGGCAQTCNNTLGSYSCQCNSGFTLAADGHNCTDINECASGNSGCAQICNNTLGSYSCQCHSGYTLAADGHNCTDIDECLVSNGGCGQICNNTLGSYSCECNPGYTLAADGRTCLDINECAVGNGGCQQLCINGIGNFSCKCEAGYTLDANGMTCTNINECALGIDGCHKGCVDTPGSYYCTCPGPDVLNPTDNRTCVSGDCRIRISRKSTGWLLPGSENNVLNLREVQLLSKFATIIPLISLGATVAFDKADSAPVENCFNGIIDSRDPSTDVCISAPASHNANKRPFLQIDNVPCIEGLSGLVIYNMVDSADPIVQNRIVDYEVIITWRKVDTYYDLFGGLPGRSNYTFLLPSILV